MVVAMATSRAVLYLVPSAGIGGAETFIQHAARYHGRYRPVFVLFREGPLAEWIRRQSPSSLRLLRSAPRLSRPLSVASAVNEIASLARAENAALIHSTMAYGALFGAPASLAAGIPHVWFQHGPVSGWMDRLAGALPARAILCNSNFTRERQKALQLVDRELVPFRLGVDLARAEEEAKGAEVLRERLLSGAPAGALAIGLFCRLQPFKGVEVFIDAVSEAARNHPIRGFVFGSSPAVGASGYERELRARAEASGVVRLLEATEHPFEAIGAMDVVVNSSVMPESFGLTLIEAMAAGRVALAPRQGGPLDFVEDGVTGLFFTPGDARDLARKLVRLAEDASFRHALSEEARLRAHARFDARNSIADLERIYDRVSG